MNNAPIFIVGVPRSGTTLLAAMLAAHSRISCGPETHFFRKLSEVGEDQLVMPATWPDAAVDFVCSIEHAGFSNRKRIALIEKYNIDRCQIAVYLGQKEPSIANILSSITDQYRIKMGKMRWAEKTPDHIMTLHRLRQSFPDSPVVRIIRDPRDVALSLTKVPWGAMSFLEALLLWKKLDEESDDFFQSDPQSFTLLFEDLITSPTTELTRLCDFLHEEFEPGMLDTSQTGKQLNARNVTWKEKVSQPVDASRRAVWKTSLAKEDNLMAEAILGGRLDALGYPREADLENLGEVYPSFTLVPKYSDAVKRLASRGIRFYKTKQNESLAAMIYLGDPMKERWFTGNRLRHLLGALSILVKLLIARLSGKSIYWIPGDAAGVWSGYIAYVLKKVFSTYKFPVEDTGV